MSPPLMIVGASARAAAWSAVRAGLPVVAGDWFGDIDLREICPAERIVGGPAGLEEFAASAPPGPWLYTGGLENHPSLVDRVSASRPLWGNGGNVLRRIRDPVQMAQALRDDGLCVPAVTLEPPRLAAGGMWLEKPLRSCGGTGIRFYRSPACKRQQSRPCYYQRFVTGDSVSALYLASPETAVLLGVTRQLIGLDWTGASGFRYCGSVGPLPIGERCRESWRRIGRSLSQRFGLRGLFGVDAIQRSPSVWPVEVNPRWTASSELIEEVLDISLIRLHADACRAGRLPPEPRPKPTAGYHGKAIVYASRDFFVSVQLAAKLQDLRRLAASYSLADIPDSGQTIRRGRPVITVLVKASDLDQLLAELKHHVTDLRSVLRC